MTPNEQTMPDQDMPGEQATETEPSAMAAQEGGVDVDAIRAKIEVPPNLLPVYKKNVIAGNRIMFDKKSHKMMLDQLDKEGDLAQNISIGAISLVYMLFKMSQQTLPPQLGIPLAFEFTLTAFEFLQKSGDERATPELLGAALEKTMEGFGAKNDQVENMMGDQPAEQPTEPPQPGAMPQSGMPA